MPKYVFEEGGETDFFNNLADQYIGQSMQQAGGGGSDDEQAETTPDNEDSEYISNLRKFDDEQSRNAPLEDLTARFSKLEELLNTRINYLDGKTQEYDWFQDVDSQDYLTDMYDTRNETTPYTTHPMQQAAASNFGGIFRNEGAATGQHTNLNSSAVGRGQMVKGTRQAMYKKLGLTDVAAAEQRFKTDPDFEMQIMNTYRDELGKHIPDSVQGADRDYMIAKGWYTGDPNYPDNKVPHPEAGNKLTAGEYARRAVKNNK